MSLAIDVFFQRDSNCNLTKLVYVTIIFLSDQDMMSSLIMADHVLQQYKADIPTIKKLYIKSDNAGCYSAGPNFEAERNICRKHGYMLMRHDFKFSEPQCGKDGKCHLTCTINASGNPHTAEHLENLAREAITATEAKFSCKISSFVSDNASNMAKMRKNLSKDDETETITYGCSLVQLII